MCNHELLVAYLYDDLTAAERGVFESHARECGACREELRQLRSTRRHLGSWGPPEAGLDVQMVRRGPGPRRSWAPAWGLAAAASIFVLAGAAALANLDVRIGSEGITVRTGWAPPGDLREGTGSDVTVAGAGGSVAAAPAEADAAAVLAALEARVRDLEAARLAPVPAPSPAPVVDRRAFEDLEGRLGRLVAESERRQRAEMALQIAKVWKDLSAVRASDFVRVQESLDRVQGQTALQLRQHRDQVQSQLYRVSIQR
jgi:hypothetical protein